MKEVLLYHQNCHFSVLTRSDEQNSGKPVHRKTSKADQSIIYVPCRVPVRAEVGTEND